MVGGAESPAERLLPELTDMNARKSIPFFVNTVVVIPPAFDPLNVDCLGRLIHRTADQQQAATCGRYPTNDSARRHSKSGGCQRPDARVQDNGGRGVDVVQDRYRESASGRRPGEIRGVELSRVRRKARQRNANNN